MGKDTKLCLQHKIHLRQQYPRDVAPLCIQEILIVRKSYVQAIHVSGCVGPEEMCLSLEHQNPSKTSEIMGYFDRVDDRRLQFRYTFCIPQTKRLRARKSGLQYKILFYSIKCFFTV